MNSLTNAGEQESLTGDGFVAAVATLHLYTSVSIPTKAGTGFTEPPIAHGYSAIALDAGDWAYSVVRGKGRVTLTPLTFAATGGTIPNVAGAYLAKGDGTILGWWEFPAANINDGESLDLSGLYVG